MTGDATKAPLMGLLKNKAPFAPRRKRLGYGKVMRNWGYQ
jgi:hypothetical protein